MGEEELALQAFRDQPPEKEPRDLTKWVWLGVLILFVVMIGSFWISRNPRPVSTSVQAKHILISFDAADPVDRGRAYERISELRERIVAGENFESMARAHSDDTVSARRGGDLGWAPRDTYAAVFEEFCWGAPIGELSDVIQTQFGFHLVVVVDRHIADAELYEVELEQRAFEELRRQNQNTQ
jgi:peptidyl-prolyl cis-trans isomerase SurA